MENYAMSCLVFEVVNLGECAVAILGNFSGT
jgi:hypothetical protein